MTWENKPLSRAQKSIQGFGRVASCSAHHLGLYAALDPEPKDVRNGW